MDETQRKAHHNPPTPAAMAGPVPGEVVLVPRTVVRVYEDGRVQLSTPHVAVATPAYFIRLSPDEARRCVAARANAQGTMRAPGDAPRTNHADYPAPAVCRDHNPSGGWPDRLLVLWEEDDAPVPDRERTAAAFERITGRPVGAYIEKIDDGDSLTYLYRGGWVRRITACGGLVAVAVKPKT